MCGANFFALAPTSGRAGRSISRTGRRNTATLKPTTPLHTHNKGPLKPASPLRPKTAPKTPISRPQRRWRFQSHTDTSEQRRRWFQTTGPPGRQGQAAVPAGPEAMSGPAISHMVSLTRTLTRWPALGPFNSHAGQMTCARATPPRRMLRGLRAYQGVNVHVRGFACEQDATTDTVVLKTQTTSPTTDTVVLKTQTTSPTTDTATHKTQTTLPTTPRFPRFSPRRYALWAPHQPKSRSDFRQTGEMASLEPRHAGDTPTASF